MTFFSFSETSVNKIARKKRHEQLQLLSPLLKNWKQVQGLLTPRERKIERNFFWRATSVSVLSFFVFTLFPQFVSTEEEFWMTPLQMEDVFFQESYDVGMLEEGFLVKPEIIDADVSRIGMTDIVEYEVQSGDTISEIAQKFGVTRKTIIDNNNLTNPNVLKKGQVLKIIPVNGLIHEVKKGDTIDKLAKKYKVKDADILSQNNLQEGVELAIVEELIIPGAKKDPPPKVYVAKSGGGGNGYMSAPSDAGYAPSSGVGLIRPTSGGITQYYRYGHYAIDIAAPGGATIYAAADGTVEKAATGWNGGYGNVIIIDHGNGLKTLYAHNREMYVVKGQWVSQGQPISFQGNTGRVYGRTGIHLHFEVREDGVKKNPLLYF